VFQEGLHITLAIDAKEGRDVMSADIPNAFIQSRMKVKVRDERIIMMVQGDVVEFLLKIAPHTYGGYVVHEKKEDDSLLSGTKCNLWHIRSVHAF